MKAIDEGDAMNLLRIDAINPVLFSFRKKFNCSQ
jgi:hypothetical protein